MNSAWFDLLGVDWPVSLGITGGLAGGCAWMMGRAVAETWRPVRQVWVYGSLLALGDRFLIFALFKGPLLSLSGLALDALFIVTVGLIAFRLARVRRMTAQYPWLFDRAGLFGWRDKG